jgi:hypothetical protein
MIKVDKKIAGRDSAAAERIQGLTTRAREGIPRNQDMPFLRTCRTGEVICAEPVSLRKKIIVAMAALPFGLGAIFIGKPWMLEYLHTINEVGKTNPARASLAYAHFFAYAFLPEIVFVAYMIAGEIYRCTIAIRAGRWPIAGAKVRRKTAVIKGWCLYLRCLILPLLLCATLVASWIALIHMISFFANNYLDFNVLAVLSKRA